jgi:hypothetical protein
MGHNYRGNGGRAFTIPALVIFEAVMHQAAWYNRLIPDDWSIAVSGMAGPVTLSGYIGSSMSLISIL